MSSPLDEYVHGRVEVIEFGRFKVARRDELAAFAAWYNAGPARAYLRRGRLAPGLRPAATMDERRATLRAAIARWRASSGR